MASTTAHLCNNLIMCSSLDTSKIWCYKAERARDNHPGSLSEGRFWKHCYQQNQGWTSTVKLKLVLSKSRQSHTWRTLQVGFSSQSHLTNKIQRKDATKQLLFNPFAAIICPSFTALPFPHCYKMSPQPIAPPLNASLSDYIQDCQRTSDVEVSKFTCLPLLPNKMAWKHRKSYT